MDYILRGCVCVGGGVALLVHGIAVGDLNSMAIGDLALLLAATNLQQASER